MKRAFSSLSALAVPFLFAAACGTPPAALPPPPPPPVPSAVPEPAPQGKVVEGASGVDMSAIDTQVSPCEDFFGYACNGWIKAHPIPAEETSWMRSFSVMREENEKTLHEILEKYAKGEGKDEPYAKLLGDFYGSCMDEAGIEKAGKKPLEADLKLVQNAKDAKSLSKVIGKLHKSGTVVFFDYGPEQDFKDASRVIFAVHQAGLGMPDRSYYLEDTEKFQQYRAAYKTYVTTIFQLLGDTNAAASADTVIAFETEIAKGHWTPEQLRVPDQAFKAMDAATAPWVDHKQVLKYRRAAP